MKALILKDLYNNKAILLMGLFMILLLSFLVDISNVLMMSLVLSVLIVFITCGSVVFLEAYEDKHKGHKFLATMPLSTVQVLGAKACLTGTTIAFHTSLALALIALRLNGPEIMVYIRSIILAAGNLSFILAGLMYLFIFAAGSKRLNKALKIGIPVIIMTILMVLFLTKNNSLTIDYKAVDAIIQNANWVLITVICIFIFALSMFVSTRLKKEVF